MFLFYFVLGFSQIWLSLRKHSHPPELQKPFSLKNPCEVGPTLSNSKSVGLTIPKKNTSYPGHIKLRSKTIQKPLKPPFRKKHHTNPKRLLKTASLSSSLPGNPFPFPVWGVIGSSPGTRCLPPQWHVPGRWSSFGVAYLSRETRRTRRVLSLFREKPWVFYQRKTLGNHWFLDGFPKSIQSFVSIFS